MELAKESREQREVEGKLSTQCLIEQEKKSFPQEGIDLLCILAPICQVPGVSRIGSNMEVVGNIGRQRFSGVLESTD